MSSRPTDESEMNPYIIYVKAICRICLIAIFLISSTSITITWSWTAFISLLCLVASYIIAYISKQKKDTVELYENEGPLVNPFKGKKGNGNIDPEKEKEYDIALKDFVLYDASNTTSLKNFKQIKKQSECSFAKKAKVWGSPDYQENISLEENITSLYPVFLRFAMCCQSLGLDAFVIELPGHLYGKDIKVFGDAVRRTLVTLKNCDKKRDWIKSKRLNFTTASDISPPLENSNEWSKIRWVFEINMTTFFITSFAPFYPETNSRYSYGAEHCYILFQPEISFAIHDLPPDTPMTNWLHPLTVRDKIRKAFHDKGREYIAPLVLREPHIYDMVKRIEPEDDSTMWWIDDSETQSDRKKQE